MGHPVAVAVPVSSTGEKMFLARAYSVVSDTRHFHRGRTRLFAHYSFGAHAVVGALHVDKHWG